MVFYRLHCILDILQGFYRAVYVFSPALHDTRYPLHYFLQDFIFVSLRHKMIFSTLHQLVWTLRRASLLRAQSPFCSPRLPSASTFFCVANKCMPDSHRPPVIKMSICLLYSRWSCFCLQNGQVQCDTMLCPIPTCQEPRKIPDQCCPEC